MELSPGCVVLQLISESGSIVDPTLYTFQVWPNTTLFPYQHGPPSLSLCIWEVLVQMVFQRWNDWLSQTWLACTAAARIRKWNGQSVPSHSRTAFPVKSCRRYTTDIASKGEMWTDANGREFQRRLRQSTHRTHITSQSISPIVAKLLPTVTHLHTDTAPHHTLTPSLSLHFTPSPCMRDAPQVTTAAYINDTKTSLAVLVDRAEGAASLQGRQPRGDDTPALAVSGWLCLREPQ